MKAKEEAKPGPITIYNGCTRIATAFEQIKNY